MPLSGHRMAHERAKWQREHLGLLLFTKSIPRAFKRL
jgi:hypothetical protein